MLIIIYMEEIKMRAVQFKSILEELLNSRGFNGKRKILASQVGLKSAAAITHYTTGTATPSFEVLVRLAEALNVSLDYLVFGETEIEKQPALTSEYNMYLEKRLNDLIGRIDRKNDLTSRLSRTLMNRLADSIDSLPNTLLPAGFLLDDETMVLEECSESTSIISLNFIYDLEIDSNPTAGRFARIVAENLKRNRQYKFLFPKDMTRIDRGWKEVVEEFRTIIANIVGTRNSWHKRCQFRVAQGSLLCGAGFYKLNTDQLRECDPALYERISDSLSSEGYVGYVIPPSTKPQGDMLMDSDTLNNGLHYFNAIWRRAAPI